MNPSGFVSPEQPASGTVPVAASLSDPFGLTMSARAELSRITDRNEPTAGETASTSASPLTPEQFATMEYNFMVADMFTSVPMDVLQSSDGQALIRYFMERIKKHFEKDFERL